MLMMILKQFYVLTVSPKHLPKTKKRSVDPHPNVLEVYLTRKRQGSLPTSDHRVIHEHFTNEHLQSKQSLERAYCLSKLQEVDGQILPGWTWYNTHQNSTTILPCQTGMHSSDRCQPNKNGHCLHHFRAMYCFCR